MRPRGARAHPFAVELRQRAAQSVCAQRRCVRSAAGAVGSVNQLGDTPISRDSALRHADFLRNVQRGAVVRMDHCDDHTKPEWTKSAHEHRARGLRCNTLPPCETMQSPPDLGEACFIRRAEPTSPSNPDALRHSMAQEACGSGRPCTMFRLTSSRCDAASSGPPINLRTTGSASMATIASRSESVRARRRSRAVSIVMAPAGARAIRRVRKCRHAILFRHLAVKIHAQSVVGWIEPSETQSSSPRLKSSVGSELLNPPYVLDVLLGG